MRYLHGRLGPLTAAILTFLAAGCAGSTEPRTIESITLSPQAAVFDVGDTQQYTVRAYDVAGDEVSVTDPTWRNDSPDVITLTDSGLATAIAPGYGQVTVTVAGISTSVGLTVATPEP